VVGIAGGVVVLLVALVLGVVAMRSFADGLSLTTSGEPAPSDERLAPGTPDPREQLPAPDVDDLDGVDAELAAILIDVDRAEEQMLATQDRFAELLTTAALEPDDDGALVEGLSEAAQEGQEELQEIRSDLAGAPAGTSAVREMRDVYLDHLDAWVRYFVAIEADPLLLAGGGDEAPYLLAINSSGDAFARSVREGLPDDLDPEVVAYAEAIVDRGFPERDLSSDDTV
jgi:hypothetical protein